MKSKSLAHLALLAFLCSTGASTNAMAGTDFAQSTVVQGISKTTVAEAPIANLFNLQFNNADHSVTDLSANKVPVTGKGTTSVVDKVYGMTGGLFTGKTSEFYLMNYDKSSNITNAFKTQFSMELFYQPTAADKDMCPLGAQESGGFRFGQTAKGKIQFIIGLEPPRSAGKDRKYHTVESKTTVTAGEYYHVVASFSYNQKDKDIIRLYVNGKLENTLEVSGAQGYFSFPTNAYRQIAIGGDFNSTKVVQKPFYGKVLMAKMYDKQISDAEVSALFGNIKKVNQQTVEEVATEALACTGVGYPIVAEHDKLAAALENYQQSGKTPADENTLQTAIDAYKTTADIQYPENGKAYTFSNVTPMGTAYYLKYLPNAMYWSTDVKDATTYVCRQLDNGKFVFVDNQGKYLVWKGKPYTTDSHNKNKGYADTYAEGVCDFDIKKMTTTPEAATKLFGFVTLSSQKSTGDAVIITTNNQGSYVSMDGVHFDEKNSSAIVIKEATYANVVTPKPATGVEGIDYLATFSAPFSTLVPEGITAYYASEKSADGKAVVIKPVDNPCIPAGQGVLLASTNDAAFAMIPATTEATAHLNNNLLKASAGATKTVAAADHAYVLGMLNGQVAFYKAKVDSKLPMNRAYLALAESQATIAMRLEGESTGIEAVETQEGTNHQIYELSGRKVYKTQPGHIYIQNGKKFIVK